MSALRVLFKATSDGASGRKKFSTFQAADYVRLPMASMRTRRPTLHSGSKRSIQRRSGLLRRRQR